VEEGTQHERDGQTPQEKKVEPSDGGCELSWNSQDGWYNRMNEKGISDLGNKQGSKILGLKHRLEIRSRYC
jgi:hypothetical protein